MAQAIKDSFLDLERHRKRLEDNIEQLRKSLRHWQIWEAEYEALKEDILAVDPAPDSNQLLEIARNYEGELVNKKEVAELLGSANATPRTSAQIINLLDRRLDYVEQNCLTIKKQIETVEQKLTTATIISTPDVRNEEGLPLTEIVEELDEEGNVISSHTSTPGSSKSQLLEVLKKAGVKDIPEGSPSSPKPESAKVERETKAAPEVKAVQELKAVDPPKAAKPAKKGVKFAPDTKTGPEQERSQTAKRIEQIMSIAKQQQGKPSEAPIIPTNETPEDAALRQEMIQYSLSEVGAVVAELDLEEGSDWSEDDYDDEIDDTDDEDEYGRSTGRVVSDELRQQMIDLEAKLGVRVTEKLNHKASDVEYVKEGIGRVTISGNSAQSNSNTDQPATGKGSSTKKAVRFSEDIDINSDPSPPPSLQPKKTAPVGNVVERNPTSQAAPPTKPKKTSRFAQERAAREAAAMSPSQQFPILNQEEPTEHPIRTVPTGPEGKILAPSIIEHDTPLDASATEPDEWDPKLLHQEVATEYHKMRNRMIQRQGGFGKEEESEIVPFTEEEGGPKKMSRFKAARLASAGR